MECKRSITPSKVLSGIQSHIFCLLYIMHSIVSSYYFNLLWTVPSCIVTHLAKLMFFKVCVQGWGNNQSSICMIWAYSIESQWVLLNENFNAVIQAGGKFIAAESLLVKCSRKTCTGCSCVQDSRFFVTAIFSEQQGRLEIRSSSTDSRMSFPTSWLASGQSSDWFPFEKGTCLLVGEAYWRNLWLDCF